MTARAVFLVGFMASGKSSVGRELAQRLGWEFLDLDERIEVREQKTIPEIFRERGEAGFRLAEANALRDLMAESLRGDSVVALGGGAFVQEDNRRMLRQWPSVFLETSASELWQRSLADGTERPLRGNAEEFARLYAERLPFYREATVTIVTSGKDLATICNEIECTLQGWGKAEAAGSYQVPPIQSRTGESK
jgi:shikimate kinase